MKRTKRITLLAVLALLLTLPGLAAYPCQTACLAMADDFIHQCYLSTGDASACTTAGALIYDNCMNNCPGRPPR